MTQYATDFSEYTAGVQPNDWTKRYEATFAWEVVSDATGSGGKILKSLPSATAGRNGLSWDAIDADPDRADSEVYIRLRFPSALSNAEIMALIRGQGSTGSETMYRHGARPSSGAGNNELNKYVSGAFDTIHQSPYTYSLNVFYHLVVRVNGSDHSIKLWADGGQEPAGWLATIVDSDITGVGYVGLFQNRTEPVDVDFFGVGTGGDAAPRAVIGPSVTLDNATCAPGQDVTGTATNFSAEPTTLSLSDGASPAYTPTPTFTANGDNWDFSATIEDFAAQAKAAGEGVPIQGLIPGTITVTVE